MNTTNKEKPILFSPDMVRAILDGRKTQTRRVDKRIEPQKGRLCRSVGNGTKICIELDDELGPAWHPYSGSGLKALPDEKLYEYSPYGRPGDELWVRETHAYVPKTAFQASVGVPQVINPNDDYEAAIYRASFDRSQGGIKWRPSIHMHRWASRIQLTVKDIRVERLQNISEEDALAEGIERTDWKYSCSPYRNYKHEEMAPGCNCSTARKSFQTLWDSINADPKPVKADGEISHYVSYPWEDIQKIVTYRDKPWHIIGNPWVWVVEFSVKEVL